MVGEDVKRDNYVNSYNSTTMGIFKTYKECKKNLIRKQRKR